MADPKYGSMAIEYQQVPCTPPGGMVAHVTDTRGQGGWSRFGIEVRASCITSDIPYTLTDTEVYETHYAAHIQLIA